MPNNQTRGAVVTCHGRRIIVALNSGESFVAVTRKQGFNVVCNDRVVLSRQANQWYVEEVLPRRNVFQRTDGSGRRLTLAANIDCMIVVCAARPEPGPDTLEKYLVAAANLDIPALLAANKSDLPSAERRALTLRLDCLRRAGFECIGCSTRTDHGLEPLRARIAGLTVMLVGQSGVGKSSIGNRLRRDEGIQTAALSRRSGKGTHTTTTTKRHVVAGLEHTYLIDSPGVWEFSLGPMEAREVALGFPDFAPFEQTCRYRNCIHVKEPSCAVREAVEAGRLDPQRHQSYCRIMAELARRR